MTTRAAHPNYVLIGIVLGVLMLLGVVLCEWRLGLSRSIIVTTVLVFSTVKATLVALYYMHLRFDSRLLILVALAPFLLILLALSVVFASKLVRL